MGRRWHLGTMVLVPALATAGDYHVGAGDKLNVHVYDEPDLSGEVLVSEGCTVTLALVGRLSVCGLTPTEIEHLVTDAYAGDYLVNPTIAVKVVDYRSQRIDVMGEVNKRGPMFLERPTSVVEVVSLAGGPTAENVVNVEVYSADGTVASYDLNALTASVASVMVQAGDRVVLKPGEVVFVEGEIKRPGSVTLSEGLTVTQALALAGGPDEYANLRRVLVRRADGSQVRVNVQRVHRGAEDDLVLAADDYLIVPRGAF